VQFNRVGTDLYWLTVIWLPVHDVWTLLTVSNLLTALDSRANIKPKSSFLYLRYTDSERFVVAPVYKGSISPSLSCTQCQPLQLPHSSLVYLLSAKPILSHHFTMELINHIVASLFEEGGETVPVDQDDQNGSASGCVIA
jgi:hypothetical protein